MALHAPFITPDQGAFIGNLAAWDKENNVVRTPKPGFLSAAKIAIITAIVDAILLLIGICLPGMLTGQWGETIKRQIKGWRIYWTNPKLE